MSGPQLQNGFVQIAHEILRAITRSGMTSRQKDVTLAVIDLTWGAVNAPKTARISLGDIAEYTGMHRGDVSKTVDALIAAKVIVVHAEGSHRKSRLLGVNKHYKNWELDRKSEVIHSVGHATNCRPRHQQEATPPTPVEATPPTLSVGHATYTIIDTRDTLIQRNDAREDPGRERPPAVSYFSGILPREEDLEQSARLRAMFPLPGAAEIKADSIRYQLRKAGKAGAFLEAWLKVGAPTGWRAAGDCPHDERKPPDMALADLPVDIAALVAKVADARDAGPAIAPAAKVRRV